MKTSPRPVDLSAARARRRETATPLAFNQSRQDSDRIAQRGYEARGRKDGRDMDDKFEAERELQGVSADSTDAQERDSDSDEAA